MVIYSALIMDGCIRDRNQESMYETVINEFHTWPEYARKVIQFLGTLAFATICILLIGYARYM